MFFFLHYMLLDLLQSHPLLPLYLHISCVDWWFDVLNLGTPERARGSQNSAVSGGELSCQKLFDHLESPWHGQIMAQV